MQHKDLIKITAVLVAGLTVVLLLGVLRERGRSVLTTGQSAAAPGAPLPCGHPLGRFDKDPGAMQTGQAYCIHGHSYSWIHQQWKVGMPGAMPGMSEEWSPNAPGLGPTSPTGSAPTR